jgi:hypothetical protein
VSRREEWCGQELLILAHRTTEHSALRAQTNRIGCFGGQGDDRDAGHGVEIAKVLDRPLQNGGYR